MSSPKKDSSGGTYFDRMARLRRKASKMAERHGMQAGFRSGLEAKIAKLMQDMGVEFGFETAKIDWTPRPIPHKYTPDYLVHTASGKPIYIESKGRFMPDDMEKHLAIKEQHPEIDIRFVFQRSNTWYRKAVRRSYAKWCDEHGYKYCDFPRFKDTLAEWLAE